MKKINLQVSKVPHFGHFKLISLLIKYSRFVDTCKLRLHRNLLLSKGSLPDTQRSQYYGTGFWEKKKRYCEVTQQGSNPSPWCKVWGVKGFQHWIFLDRTLLPPVLVLVSIAGVNPSSVHAWATGLAVCSLVSEKQLSVLQETGKGLWATSAVTNTHFLLFILQPWTIGHDCSCYFL